MIFQKCLDTLRHDRMRTQKVHEDYEESARLPAVLRHIVLDVDLLIEVLTDDECEHRLDTADADKMLGNTVTAVLTGT